MGDSERRIAKIRLSFRSIEILLRGESRNLVTATNCPADLAVVAVEMTADGCAQGWAWVIVESKDFVLVSPDQQIPEIAFWYDTTIRREPVLSKGPIAHYMR
jgi:hypothetical protein